MKDLRVSLAQLVVVSSIAVSGCGGGASTSPAPVAPPPTSASATLSGQWQIVAHSNVNPASSILVEANFSQDGPTVAADKSNVVLIEGVPGAFTGLAGECDGGVLGGDSVQASVSGQTVSFTLTESGSLGTGTTTGSATMSGTQLTGGTYQTPAACGFAADSGSLTGTAIQPLSGTFAGQLLNFVGTTDAVVLTVSQSGYTLNAVGTDAGAPITLTGKVIGATFDVTGVVQGQSREYVGIYDPNSKSFLVYDNQFQPLGTLNAQAPAPAPTPISVSLSPTSATVRVSQPQTFTATVSNDSAAKGVTWAASCATAGGCGSLSATTSGSGTAITYTAPAAVPNPATITLMATSVADSTKSASASITITATPASVSGVTVTCSPATISVGSTSMCSAVVAGSNSPSQSVTWTATGGTVTAAGVFTGSAAGSSTITATSVVDTTKLGTAVVVVQPSASQIATGTEVHVDPSGIVEFLSTSNVTTAVDLSKSNRTPSTYQGTFDDLRAGVVLTEVDNENESAVVLEANGSVISSVNGFTPQLISATDAGYVSTAGGVCQTDVIACDFGKPAGSDIVALRGSDGTVGSIVWSVEDDSNPTMCVPWYADAEAFAVQGNNSSNAVQVGQSAQCGTVGVWRDEKGLLVWQISGSSVLASSSTDGTNWTSSTIFLANDGDQFFASVDRAPSGSYRVLLSRFQLSEQATSVWEVDGDGVNWGSPVRLSNIENAGSAGGSNPIALEGHVAWIADVSSPNHFDVWLDGKQFTSTGDVDEGPFLVNVGGAISVVWSDLSRNIWSTKVTP